MQSNSAPNPSLRSCCLPMDVALQSKDRFCAISGRSGGRNVIWLSADGGASTLCQIEFCPWCGTEIRFRDPSMKEHLDDVSSGKMMG